MADATHLEKMGRELKCPICLSLLNSSVSLTCNHVFCNSCIMKSMKLGSNCPVCKVPFQRREVRPAPHMDNLVNIYKGMEVASGVNIFVSQNLPSAKLSDTGKEPEGDPNYEDNQGICLDQVENKKASMGRKRRKANIYTPKKCGTISAKPSFPTKKRVQVSQYPPQETPTRPAKVQGCSGETSVDRCKISSTKIKENLVPNENGESVFTPFFWLRDEEGGEKASQQSDSNQLLDMPTPDVPSFSDIKDSDDEGPKLAPEETHGESNAADFFDSEMFDWTQGACSPELCSTPMKIQEKKRQLMVMNNDQITEIGHESETELQSLKETKYSSTGGEQFVNTNQGGSTAVLKPPVSSPRVKDAADQIERKKSNKRSRKTMQITQNKRGKQTEAEPSEIHVEPKEGSVKLVEDQAGNKDDGSVSIEEIRTGMGASFDISVCKLTPQNASAVSPGIENMNQCNKNSVIKLPISSVEKSRGGEKLKVKKSGKNCKTSNHRTKKAFPAAGSKKQKLHPGNFTVEEPSSENKKNEDDINASNIEERLSVHDREIKSAISLKGNQRSRCKKVSFTVSEMVTEPAEKVQDCSAVRLPNASTTRGKPSSSNNEVLRKCKNISSKIQCAFCHSSEGSEASGEMVHFCDGKPVAEDYNGGSKVIHSHKNCAEWAPNVYFKGDTAINLEAELARSRRIPCSCCGIKGAALGCYEKSCRKSFHVPCAKLIPQCRWDTDKFVMLCPLHPTSKFTETSGSHERTKGSKAKGQQCTLDDQVAMKHDNNTNQNWKLCGSPKKLILCCSALTVADRETISVFKEFCGVTEHKKWNSSVTHVIASTDENGACRRTLKVLMGILEGKWIVSIDWVKACMQAMKPVSEEPYEITVDVHGIRDGPQLGRLRLQNKQPKLFDGLKFYLIGDFVPSYKGYLQELIIAAGGSILHRKPIPRDQEAILGSSSSSTFIIYSKELDDNTIPSKKNLLLKHRQSDAKALASSTGTMVASNMWVLDCIAACKLQNL